MTKTLPIAVVFFASIGLAMAQDRAPGNKNEAPTPAPPAQQNAPPDKVAPGAINSPNAEPPDAKAEATTPTLKMDSGADKKLPASQGGNRALDPKRP